MSTPDPVLTPAQQLAQRIAQRLVDKYLLTPELALGILPRLADGKLQPSDWKLTFEKALNLHKQS